jgi:hypothetical protein
VCRLQTFLGAWDDRNFVYLFALERELFVPRGDVKGEESLGALGTNSTRDTSVSQ